MLVTSRKNLGELKIEPVGETTDFTMVESIINYKKPIINIVDKFIDKDRELDKEHIINLIIGIIEEHIENFSGDFFENEEDETIKYKIQNGDILDVFYNNIYKEIQLPILIDIFKFIDINSRYELFKNVYLDTIINVDLNKVLNELKTLKTKTDIEYLNSIVDEEGNLKIYRGEGSLSQRLEDGAVYSWSLEKEVARKFANRFSKAGIIYTGKIKVFNVSAYITERNENEIVALLKDIKIINKEESISNLFK
ncbi:hypothetical protein DP149_10145 [Clostridium tetani]|nr:hypothetical protein [Clostridium tetani]KGI37932.1 hypothetical protein KY52_10385 [Clostridium tetani]KGI45345.1 hypothetical protein KY54_04375 [Clostridium tetani]KHO31965.1 hypothetical protein OR63_08005 [Clostridium tetani]KIG22148.1 hypothetical protein RS78_00580 [Clostridium tetani]RXI62088.1 hypothetical protein DP125_04715 [Clostridium tetani]